MAAAHYFDFPIAIVFAVLGRHFPHAGGVAHFVGMAFGCASATAGVDPVGCFYISHSC